MDKVNQIVEHQGEKFEAKEDYVKNFKLLETNV
jgi:hypothetical protein